MRLKIDWTKSLKYDVNDIKERLEEYWSVATILQETIDSCRNNHIPHYKIQTTYTIYRRSQVSTVFLQMRFHTIRGITQNRDWFSTKTCEIGHLNFKVHFFTNTFVVRFIDFKDRYNIFFWNTSIYCTLKLKQSVSFKKRQLIDIFFDVLPEHWSIYKVKEQTEDWS